MDLKKIAAAVILLPLFLLLIGWGSTKLLMILVIVMVVGLGTYEYANIAFKNQEEKPIFEMIMGIFFSIMVCFITSVGYSEPIMILAALTTAFILLSAAFMLREGDLSIVLEKTAKVFFGVVLLGFLGGLIVALKAMEQESGGFKLVIALFALTWVNDAGAFFVGSKFGKTKLAPNLSPNKTIEGSLGGFGATILLAAIIGYFCEYIPLNHALWLGLIMGFIGPLGDLFESALKRGAQVKDSGILLPGHGGVLDRLDSVLFNVPVLYLYVFFRFY